MRRAWQWLQVHVETLGIMRDDARRLNDMRNSEDIWDFWPEEDEDEQA